MLALQETTLRPVPVLTLLALAVLATPALAHRDDPKAYLRFEGAIGDDPVASLNVATTNVVRGINPGGRHQPRGGHAGLRPGRPHRTPLHIRPPRDLAGGFHIKRVLSEDGVYAAVLPAVCDNPQLLIRSFNPTTGLPGSWFAVGILVRDGDDD